jgi:hypothetical protein
MFGVKLPRVGQSIVIVLPKGAATGGLQRGSRMPTGPKGEKRPAAVNARAVMIAKIATGEVEDAPEDDGKDLAAKASAPCSGSGRRLVDPTTYGRATVPSRGIDPAELPVSREAPAFVASKLPPDCISRQV